VQRNQNLLAVLPRLALQLAQSLLVFLAGLLQALTEAELLGSVLRSSLAVVRRRVVRNEYQVLPSPAHSVVDFFHLLVTQRSTFHTAHL
jgi:hypothetical protein